MRKLIIVALAIFLVDGVAFAQMQDGDKHRRMGQHRQDPVMQLNLTDDQLEKARTIKGDMKRKMIALRSKMQLAKLDFDEELQKEKPSDAKLKKLIDNIANLGAEKARIHLETKMKITGILTYDQKKELAKKRFSSPMGGRGKHQGRGGKGDPQRR